MAKPVNRISGNEIRTLMGWDGMGIQRDTTSIGTATIDPSATWPASSVAKLDCRAAQERENYRLRLMMQAMGMALPVASDPAPTEAGLRKTIADQAQEIERLRAGRDNWKRAHDGLLVHAVELRRSNDDLLERLDEWRDKAQRLAAELAESRGMVVTIDAAKSGRGHQSLLLAPDLLNPRLGGDRAR